MRKRCLFAVLMTILPAVALTQNVTSYKCSYADLIRRVALIYEPGRLVPCEVRYYKDTEAPGEQKVLWRAVNQEGYCEAKTEEFIAMLNNSGWTCTPADANAPAPAEVTDETRDDSDALAPSDTEDESAADM